MSRFLHWGTLLLLLGSTLASAQTPSGLEPGQRVRVAHRCNVARDKVTECHMSRSTRLDTGQVHSLDHDTLRIRGQSADAALAIPRASIAELWVSVGSKSNFKTGVLVGLLAGALVGGVMGSGGEFCIAGSCAPMTAFGVVIGAPIGLLFGGMVGSQIQSESWRSVQVERVGTSPGRRLDTLRLGVSLVF